MKTIFLFASVSIASGLLFVNLYTSLVDVRSWGSDIPNSISTAREYFKMVNPGNFFRIFAPLNQLLGLLVLVLFWKSSSSVRVCLSTAFALYILGDVFTFAYFYPRNDIMFKTGNLQDVAMLRKIVSDWSMMNWLRSLMILAGIFFSALALHKVYSLQK